MFPASLRRQSHQCRLLEHLADVIGDTGRIDLLGDVDLPLFNEDLEASEPLRLRVARLHERWRAADGIIVASPEYNGHVSPYLKNTVDWVSRLERLDAARATANPFAGKPLLLASASTGWTGGILGLQNARSLFGYLGCLVSADQICVSNAANWQRDGRFRFEPAFEAYIARTVASFLDLVGSLAPARASAVPVG